MINLEAISQRVDVTEDMDELLDIINLMRAINNEPPYVMSDDFVNYCIGIYEKSQIEVNQ